MTPSMSETHTDVMFTDWLNQHNESNASKTFDIIELDEQKLDDDGGDKGFAILFIDKAGGHIDSDEFLL